MTYNEALKYIHSRPRLKNTDNRKAMRILMELLGNPQDKLKIVHIAGTNGKGSCAKMISNVLIKAGYKTGLNISPFVIDFTERFSVNGQFIQKETLAHITEIVKEKQEYIQQKYNLPLVEFEIVTAIAFYYFWQEKCDIVCLEVGIGGLQDSTNIIKSSLISCIMNISFDHTEILGDTIEKIAYEKAGIIKENQKVICYPDMHPDALNVIKTVAKAQNAAVVLPDKKDMNVECRGNFEYVLHYKDYTLKQSFTGIHQSYNALVVICACEELRNSGYNIKKEDIIYGIENTQFPARIEILSKNPLIILDGGHNLDGVCALKEVLTNNNAKDFTAVWASLSDKNPKQIIQLMAPLIKKVYTVDLFGSRAVKKEELADMAKEYIPNSFYSDDLESTIKNAVANKENLLVFGSLYLASDARNIIKKFL